MESRTEMTAPLLHDIAVESPLDDAHDPNIGDVATLDAEAGHTTPSLGNTPVRNVGDSLLTNSEDVPLLMDMIAVDANPNFPEHEVGEIPEVNSVIALPDKLSAAVATALAGQSSPRTTSFSEARISPPSLSLVTKELATAAPPPTESRLSLVETPTPVEDAAPEGSEVLDDTALLALLNAPTQPAAALESSNYDMPEMALGNYHSDPNLAPEDEPLEFTQSYPPADFSEAVSHSTSQLVAQLQAAEQDISGLSLTNFADEEGAPTMQDGRPSPSPESLLSPSAEEALPSQNVVQNAPINAAASTLAGELQQQLYRKIDTLIAETVDSLTRDLHKHLGKRIEDMVLAAIDETVPQLLEQFSTGLQRDLRPKLQAKMPELLAEVLGAQRF